MSWLSSQWDDLGNFFNSDTLKKVTEAGGPLTAWATPFVNQYKDTVDANKARDAAYNTQVALARDTNYRNTRLAFAQDQQQAGGLFGQAGAQGTLDSSAAQVSQNAQVSKQNERTQWMSTVNTMQNTIAQEQASANQKDLQAQRSGQIGGAFTSFFTGALGGAF